MENAVHSFVLSLFNLDYSHSLMLRYVVGGCDDSPVLLEEEDSRVCL